MRAHPRSRGENAGRLVSTCTPAGSSPLTRGKHRPCAVHHFLPGLIPAHAGKTGQVVCPAARSRAHPRSRGENPVSAATNAFAAGSSPLTRGKRVTPPGPTGGPGLIPAHAGKTNHLDGGLGVHGAHPRSRGENVTRLPGLLWCLWLIPAHAGKTGGGHVRPFCVWAHPRSRGENVARVDHFRRVRGSSPLTRGKLLKIGYRLNWSGLIPAHAGKTMPPRSPRPPDPAHPRSRGENFSIDG